MGNAPFPIVPGFNLETEYVFHENLIDSRKAKVSKDCRKFSALGRQGILEFLSPPFKSLRRTSEMTWARVW